MNEKLKFFLAGASVLKVAQMLWVRFYSRWLMRKIVAEMHRRGKEQGAPSSPDVMTASFDEANVAVDLLRSISPEQAKKLEEVLTPYQVAMLAECKSMIEVRES